MIIFPPSLAVSVHFGQTFFGVTEPVIVTVDVQLTGQISFDVDVDITVEVDESTTATGTKLMI